MRWFILSFLLIAVLLGAYYYLDDIQEEPERASAPAGQAPSNDSPAISATPGTPAERPETRQGSVADVGEPARAIDPLPPSRPDPDGFIAPQFQPLEAVVGNWKSIPPSAFPREVRLSKPVSYQMRVGSSTSPAGSSAVAVDIDGSTLIIAPSAIATARGEADIDDTNFKQILSDEYDAWKDRMTKRARQQWEYARTAPERELRGAKATAAAKAAGVSAPPVPSGSGNYDLIMQSLAAKPLRELKPEHISKVSDPALIKEGGRTYWAITVDFTAQTRFGLYPAQAQALIKNNQVERWIYTGSGEPVP